MKEINLKTPKNPTSRATNNKKVIVILICISALLLMFAIIISSMNNTKPYLTYDNYSKIKTGMTYNEVVKILDNHKGSLDTSYSYGGYSSAYYTWTNSSGTRCIVVGFNNGKVCAKSQYGLN